MKRKALDADAEGKTDSTQSAAVVRYTFEEWQAEGERLFGADRFLWRFVCPVCGHVQSPRDFEQYKDLGATPDSATSECIGRYSGARSAFVKGQQPCNYAGYGLFRLSPVRVLIDDKEIHAFGFAALTAKAEAKP